MGNCCSSCFPSERKKGYTLGSSSDTASGSNRQPSRAAIAAAAEQRAQQAENRGVRPGGGKLSKQLEQERKSGGKSDDTPPVANLEWRVD
ncbi:6651_t:CDS:2 [Paraglomus brasilianum]|uniref:6651_t:CDS:1 n=1 Tax=Paraglomus brasilianum TaxID=144538 RepID=A0A9N9FV76_9GLOM|nr:6651_t:CDS:2 [Paraglomus brasilianum]